MLFTLHQHVTACRDSQGFNLVIKEAARISNRRHLKGSGLTDYPCWHKALLFCCSPKKVSDGDNHLYFCIGILSIYLVLLVIPGSF